MVFCSCIAAAAIAATNHNAVAASSAVLLFQLTDRTMHAGAKQYGSAGIAVRERLIFEDSLVGAQYIVNSQGIPEQSCHTALALTPDRMLLLGSQGLVCIPQARHDLCMQA